MYDRRYWIPSTSALVAFECAARLRNFSRAADELSTSQSAISRHIADLESRLGTRLFEREKRRIYLTSQGEQFYRSVVNGLDNIHAGAIAVRESALEEQITIACTYEVSHFFLLPRYEALQRALGEQVQIRVMTYEYDALKSSVDPRIDIYFLYQSLDSADGTNLVLREAVTPICAPEFAREHADALAKPASSWASLPFLQLGKPNTGWMTWEDWFASVGADDLSPDYTRFDNYVYLLESAAAGRGLALGWRGFIERYLSTGALQLVRDDYAEFDHGLFAVLSERGKRVVTASRCLEFLLAQGRKIG